MADRRYCISGNPVHIGSVQGNAPLPNRRTIVLYDDQCPLCTFQMRALTWIDWFNTAELLPVSHLAAIGQAPAIAREELLEAIHAVSPSGRVYRGARCIRFLGLRIPLLVPLSLLLWLPGVIQLAELIYRWISRHRYTLSRVFGCKGACGLVPARRGHADPDLTAASASRR